MDLKIGNQVAAIAGNGMCARGNDSKATPARTILLWNSNYSFQQHNNIQKLDGFFTFPNLLQ